MMRINGLSAVFLMAILANAVQAWNYSYYNYGNYGYYYGHGNNYGMTYTGMAMMQGEDGTMRMVPTNQCPHKCAIDRVCGTEQQCHVGAIVGYVFAGIGGLAFIICCLCFCCRVCCVVKEVHSELHEPFIKSDRSHHSSSSSDDEKKKKRKQAE